MSNAVFVPEKWSSYSSRYQSGTGTSTIIAIDRMLDHVAVRKPFDTTSYCLDVGTGGGSVPERIALRAPGTRVLATDLSPGMLDQVKALHLDGIVTQQEDAVTLSGLSDETFSHVFSSYAIQFASDPPATIVQLYRILQQGGVGGVVISGDYSGPVDVHNRACERIKTYHAISPYNDDAWSSVDDHRKRMQAAGFKDVKTDICLMPRRFGSAEEFCAFWFGGSPVPSRLVEAAAQQGIEESVLRKSIAEVLNEEFEGGKEIYFSAVIAVGRK